MADLRTLARSITPKRADSFLQAVLNLEFLDETPPWARRRAVMSVGPDEKTAIRFLEKFKEFFPRLDFKLGVGPIIIGQGHKLDSLKEVRRVLAMAWRRPTALSRQLCIMQLLAIYVSPRGFEGEGAIYGRDQSWASWVESRFDPFSLVGLRALQIADRMRYCPNPTCPASYFIAQRRSQKYCTDACALPAQRELKRAWWKEHGDEWRKARKASAKKSQRKRGK
jgi:hypothetical protein